MAGTSGSTKQVWGLLEQDSIYVWLRRLKHFLHDKHRKYISHQSDRITTHHTSPCLTGHNRPDEELQISSCLPKTEAFPIPSGRHKRHTRVITIRNISNSNSTEVSNMHWFKNILNRIFGERRKLSKVLECTLPFHTLKASSLNPGIIFLVWSLIPL